MNLRDHNADSQERSPQQGGFEPSLQSCDGRVRFRSSGSSGSVFRRGIHLQQHDGKGNGEIDSQGYKGDGASAARSQDWFGTARPNTGVADVASMRL